MLSLLAQVAQHSFCLPGLSRDGISAAQIFSLLILAALLVISTPVARAQSNGSAAELKRRIAAQIASETRTPTSDAVRQAEAASSVASEGVAATATGDKKKGLVGTWNVTLTFGDGTQVKSTLQVFPGRSNTEGSVIHASEFLFAPPNPTLPEQGVWEYHGGREFIASYRGYSFTEQLEPFGFIGFRHAITVAWDQQSFIGQAVFEVIDGSGQVLFSDNCQTRGVRQHAVAP